LDADHPSSGVLFPCRNTRAHGLAGRGRRATPGCLANGHCSVPSNYGTPIASMRGCLAHLWLDDMRARRIRCHEGIEAASDIAGQDGGFCRKVRFL